MLSDRSIIREIERGHLHIGGPDGGPLLPWQIQPVSVDLRLGSVALCNGTPLPPDGDTWVIHPHEFLLGSTYESVRLSENLVGTVHGKSTIAREGLMVEAAGLVDPGFRGELTLELFNMSRTAITLVRLQPICQVTLHWTDTTPQRVYNERDNHYQGQTGPTPSWRYQL